MEKTKTLEKAPSRLGRGLSALIPPPAALPSPSPLAPPELGVGGAASSTSDGISEIALADISANPNQPRTVFNEAAIADLAASIKAHGVLQPVMVRPRGGGRYELVAGERRFRAAQEAGLTRIPAVVRSFTDEESLTVALIENIQREDLNPIEAARAYKQLMEEYNLTQVQLGEQIGKQQSTISNVMRLLHLPQEIQETISSGKITLEHGKVLLAVSDLDKQRDLWQDTITLGYTVKELQVEVTFANSISPPKKRKTVVRKSVPQEDVHFKDFVFRLQSALGMKTTVKPRSDGSGTLTLEFASMDALETLAERLNGC